jgi:RNase P/RNase MRP subunit POP5
MGNFIIKFDTPDGPRYLEYSTIIDAPVTFGMTLDEFKQHYLEEYGRVGMNDLDGRLERVEQTGSSSYIHKNRAATIRNNRAGRGGTCLTEKQIVDYYVTRQGKGKQPTGPRP